MNQRRCALLLVFAIICGLVGAAPLPAAEAADVAGVWRWETQIGDNTIKSVLKLNVEKGVILGLYKNPRIEAAVQDPKFENDELKFRLDLDRDGRKFAINFAGKQKDDELTGTVKLQINGEEREFPWTAKRTLEPSDVAGLWKFTIQSPDGQTLQPTLKLNVKENKLSGVYTSQIGDRTFEPKDLALKDGRLTFEIAGDFDGQDFSVKYDGQPRGDNISGSIAFDFAGNTGDVEFTGKRENAPPAKGDQVNETDDN